MAEWSRIRVMDSTWFGGVIAHVFLVVVIHGKIIYRQLPLIVRVLQEKRLFVPQGKPEPDAMRSTSSSHNHDLILHVAICGRASLARVILSAGAWLERWLRAVLRLSARQGYDIFAFETRGQGQSLSHAGYEPMVGSRIRAGGLPPP